MNSTNVDFRVYVGEFEVPAPRAIAFGAHDAGHLIRGQFGRELFEEHPMLYRLLYQPAALREGPSGFAEPPRPYVVRARHLAHRAFAKHEAIPFVVHCFDSSIAGELGFTDLKTLNLNNTRTAIHKLRVDFLTPTELRPKNEPAFGILMRRLRDRLSLLTTLYGGKALELDFALIGERADRVQMSAASIQFAGGSRRSSSQGTRQPLGGFYGSVTYEGDLSEFLPLLRAGYYTGVGKYTVWGQGEILATVLNPATNGL
jgi:hypothetical protein